MKRLFSKLFLTGIFVICTALGIFFAVNTPKVAVADEPTDPNIAEIFSPASYPEYFKTTNAKFVDETDKHIAFVANVSNKGKCIVVYYKNTGDYVIHEDLYDGGASDGQIMLTAIDDTDYLIYQSGLKLFALNLDRTTTHNPKIFKNDLDGTEISSYNFSYNGSYFVIAQNESIHVYTLKSIEPDGVKLVQRHYYVNTPSAIVSLASDNTLYYSIGNNIYSDNLTDAILGNTTSAKIFYSSITPSYLLTNEHYLYAIANGNVIRFSTPTPSSYDVVIEGSTETVLGKIKSPKSLGVYNGNLLVVDNDTSTVQKFSLTDFEFTGWAIATTESAQNRIAKDSKLISVYDGKIATLNTNSIKITDAKTGAFEEIKDHGLSTLKMLSVGKKSLAIADGSTIKFYDLSDLTKAPTIVNQTNLESCDYSRGKYYFASTDKGGLIYVYDEDTFTLTKTSEEFLGYVTSNTKIAVDIDGVITVLFNGNLHRQNDISHAYPITGNYLAIETDLDGNVFVLLTGNRLAKLDVSTGIVTYEDFILHNNLNADYTGITDNRAISFAMSYDSKNVYFILESQSVILTSDDFTNRSITEIYGATNTLSALNGTVGNSTVKKVKVTGNNVFTVEITQNKDTFTYLESSLATDTEYLIVCEPDVGYTLLLNENGLTLVKTSKITNATENALTQSQKTILYVASEVNMYYYPVLSIENTYCLLSADNPSEQVRLSSGTYLTVQGELTLNGKIFYYVETLDNHKGYVPATFVKDSVDVSLTHATISYEMAKDGALLYAEDLSSVIYTFNKNTKVRLLGTIKNSDGKVTYALVEYFDGTTVYRGLILGEDIVNTPDHSIRNAIIILVISLAISATAIFLLGRKKVYVDAL